ncbi:MAG: hypothetical protein ACRBBK_03480 [Paracoccaceae bacterium]
MVYAAIGGMQLKHWSRYFKIIIPTLRVLKAAKRADGCLHADTFKAGDVFFALSVWESKAQMQAFARSGLHGQLVSVATDHMALFYNHSEAFEDVPSRKASVSAWQAAMAARGGKGTVGRYAALQ